jgi:hypothetical protein
MRISENAARKLFLFLLKKYAQNPPNITIGPADSVYLLRWYLIPRNKWLNAYLHHFKRSDDDTMHDHPWWNISLILQGEYTEQTDWFGAIIKKVYVAGDIKFRNASKPHRIELHAGPCWSLFITGPKIREWGFTCPRGWVPWYEYVQRTEHGNKVGRGCGED